MPLWLDSSKQVEITCIPSHTLLRFRPSVHSIIKSMAVRVFLSSLFIVGILSQGAAYAEKLSPVDEGATDPSFKAFREQLLAAAQRRDKEFIFSISASNIKYTFGRGDGLADFKKYSGFSKSNDPIWGELIEVLTLGGIFKKREDGKRYFCTPYVFCRDRDITRCATK